MKSIKKTLFILIQVFVVAFIAVGVYGLVLAFEDYPSVVASAIFAISFYTWAFWLYTKDKK